MPLDSLLDSGSFGHAEVPATQATRLRRWRHLLRPWKRADSQWLAIDTLRFCALVLALSVAAAGAAAGWLWQRHMTAADRSAAAAVDFVDSRLAAIELEFDQLAAESELSADLQPCPTALTRRLLQHSLDSQLVQRWWISDAAAGTSCGPEGPAAAIDLPLTLRATPTLHVMSRRGDPPQLMAVKRLGPTGALVALLDPRALALPAQGPWHGAAAAGEDIALNANDGRRLQLWGGAGAPATPALSVRRESSRYGISVNVDLGRELRLKNWLSLLPAALAMALLLSLCGSAWAWRRALRRVRLVHRLERALRKRQFEPFVQPIVDLASGHCVGGEVLMRWAHPHRGTLAPAEFIEVAERTGLISGMSQLVMSRAANRLAALAARQPQLYFSFNLTPEQLRAPTIAQELAALFTGHTLPRQQVLLELTEREIVDPAAQDTLAALHAAGWRVAIDDFGTGHSSLALLERLPIQRIKIDRAFVATIGERTASRPVLDAIIGLARELGIELIAEGVETQAQWDYLAARGVGYAQGYLIARPMPLQAFEQWVEAQQPGPSALAALPGSAATPNETHLHALWQRMLSTGGVDIRDRIYHLRSYRRCFVGREAVDWLVSDQGIARPEAVRIGRRLVALGWARHVCSEHDFEDADLFFEVAVDEQVKSEAPPLADLRQALGALDGGVRLASHKRGLLVHRRCTPGCQVVDWLVQRYTVSRATAAQWAAHLMRRGMLRHVYDDQPFRDDRTLYRPG